MKTIAVVLAGVLASGVLAVAQQPASTPEEKPPAPASARSEQPKALVPLKVQIVLSRFKGEKKIGSLPYVIGVAANDRTATSLRLGIEAPIGRRTGAINYRSVGTNIDCRAESIAGDSYKLAITVEDLSVLPEATPTAAEQGTAKPPSLAEDMPAFRSFKSTFIAVLRDGQTTQYTSAVDPISGEVMKIDVTLNVAK
jgi:hypothetical protein